MTKKQKLNIKNISSLSIFKFSFVYKAILNIFSNIYNDLLNI